MNWVAAGGWCVFDAWRMAYHFIWTRWFLRYRTRAELLADQERKLGRFLREVVKRSPRYAGLEPVLGAFPVLTKAEFLASFAELNAEGIRMEEATEVALRAERERDFSPELNGVTVGLSSGTSGTRHVFLVSRAERCRWAGQMLARLLSADALWRIVSPWREKLKIAFFLRASSNLYTTLGGRRVEFAYYDLTRPFGQLVEELDRQRPHVLVAPATVLAELALKTSARPEQVVSVAEVLDERDRARVEEAFGVQVAEVYQATEGFLGTSCEAGRVHVNEESLCIEQEWLDEKRERFHPIITDFSRTTQWFVRYKLNDILRINTTPCACGRVTLSLSGIEGRAEEVLWASDAAGALCPVFPDVVRQAIYAMPEAVGAYRVWQEGNEWRLQLREGGVEMFAQMEEALRGMLQRMGMTAPVFTRQEWTEPMPGEKQKRIRCIQRPA